MRSEERTFLISFVVHSLNFLFFFFPIIAIFGFGTLRQCVFFHSFVSNVLHMCKQRSAKMNFGKVKQYVFQSQDEQHYLRFSLAIAITSPHLLPRHDAIGTSPHDALELRAATQTSSGKSRDRSASVASSTNANDASLSFLFDASGKAEMAASEAAPKRLAVEVVGALWALHEDKLVVRCEEAKADVVSTYAAFHRANPLLYPKLFTDAAPFRARYNAIVEDPVRLKLVQLMPEDAVTQLDSSTLQELTRKSSSLFTQGTIAAAGTSTISHKTKAAALKAIQKSLGHNSGGGSSAYRREDLVLHSIVRQGGEQQDVSCCSEDVTTQSPLLRDLFAKSSDYQPGGAKRVTLSEKDPMWTSIPDMHSVFASDNLNRFKNFCEAPALLTTLVDLNDKLKEREVQVQEEWDEFVTQTFTKRDQELELVGTMASSASEILRTRIESAMYKDIEAIKEIYASHIYHEEQKLKQFFDKQRTNIEVFYERELASLAVLRDLTDDTEPESMAQLRAEVSALSEMCAETYGPPALPRLLMLADVLMSAELRSQCLKLIAADFSRFCSLPEMNSQLLRANTLQELLTLISDIELMRSVRSIRSSMQQAQHKGFPLDVLEAELKCRGDVRAQELFVKDISSVQDLCRRVNALLVRIKHEQAAAVSSPGSALENSGGSPASPRRSTIVSGSGGSPPPLTRQPSNVRLSATRSAMNFTRAKVQPKTLPELKKGGFVEEELYLGWRDLLQETLTRKLQQAGSEYNVAVLRIPRGMEGVCSLLDHRRGFDVKTCFKHISAEGQGCVVIGESNQLLYWEARLIFVESGTRFAATCVIGMDPVAHSMNAVQIRKYREEEQRLLQAHQESSAAAAPSSHLQSGGTTRASPQGQMTHAAAMLKYGPLSQLNATALSTDRIVGVVPVDVSSCAVTGPQHAFGVSWSADGVLNIDGCPFDIKSTFDVGDVVGVSLHTLTGDVKFYKNSVLLSNMDPKTTPVPRLRQGVAYQPCVSVFCTSMSIPSSTATHQQAGALLHQSVNADQDTVVMSQMASAGPLPKARCLVEVDGQCKVMPAGSVAFAKGATPVASVQSSSAALRSSAKKL